MRFMTPALLAIATTGCSDSPAPVSVTAPEIRVAATGEETFEEDPWLKRAPLELAGAEIGCLLPTSKSAVVTSAARMEAVARLEHAEWVRISVSEIEGFAGRKIAVGPNEVPVLLRGVKRAHGVNGDPRLDRLRVAWSGGNVLVSQNCSREAPAPPMMHSPVVAVLPSEPTAVYPSTQVSLH